MTQRRLCRIFTHALNAYQVRQYQNRTRPNSALSPKFYEGILTAETATHVWLDGVVQWDGRSCTIAIPRANITRREFPR